MSDLALGRRLMDRIEALARFTDDTEGLTRLYLSPSHRRAADALAGWMREVGMDVRMDALGTLIGRYAGSSDDDRSLLVCSHIDTVRNAGKYDGSLGVLAALTAVEALAEQANACHSPSMSSRSAMRKASAFPRPCVIPRRWLVHFKPLLSTSAIPMAGPCARR